MSVTIAAECQLPTDFGQWRLVVFGDEEHVALIYGDLDQAPNPLVRIHSECITSEVFHSRKCDCNDQKDTALQQIEQHGSGVFLYLRQEGRGIGLTNKIKAYALQDQGEDTVTAHEKLHLPIDARDFTVAKDFLKQINLTDFTLLTNNPDKLELFKDTNFNVTRQALEITPNETNQNYLHTKKTKLGHLLDHV